MSSSARSLRESETRLVVKVGLTQDRAELLCRSSPANQSEE
jgi:hypothetical protein